MPLLSVGVRLRPEGREGEAEGKGGGGREEWKAGDKRLIGCTGKEGGRRLHQFPVGNGFFRRH